jgi:hypothetical protein
VGREARRNEWHYPSPVRGGRPRAPVSAAMMDTAPAFTRCRADYARLTEMQDANGCQCQGVSRTCADGGSTTPVEIEVGLNAAAGDVLYGYRPPVNGNNVRDVVARKNESAFEDVNQGSTRTGRCGVPCTY